MELESNFEIKTEVQLHFFSRLNCNLCNWVF